MVTKRWIIQETNDELIQELSHALGISPVVAQILINRGITTVAGGQKFLACDLGDLPDPFLMLGMERAVKRIRDALRQGERITIYGDYDADGQTATSLLVRGFRAMATVPDHVDFYLPDRLEEGYGLNVAAMAKLSKETSLLVTVDCGISSVKEVALGKELGLEIIITDHHEPGSLLPEALAILNPKQPDCLYPNKNLAGVGVALKLLQGLGLEPAIWYSLLDLVALGTVADLVPLQGENRILVHHGLRQMTKTENIGLRALLEVAEVATPTAGALGFRLGPRLNAAGRLGDPTRGVRLLLTSDPEEAREAALELHHENLARQELEKQVLDEAVEVVERYELHKGYALVVWGQNWHPGVIGIVASRLVERYYLPTIVISVQADEGVASGRGIAGLNLYQTLGDCADLLTKYGGHTMAAGLSLPTANLREFQRRFNELCGQVLQPDDYIPKLYIDSLATLSDLTPELIGELAKLEPHGMGNPGPSLQTNVSVLRTRRVGQEARHLQLTVQDQTATDVAAIAFNAGESQNFFELHAEGVGLAFVPSVNEWRNEKQVQLQVKAWEQRPVGPVYVRQWMRERYPWRLGSAFYQTQALELTETLLRETPTFQMVDLRGTWDKAGALVKERGLSGRALILVNTPARALEVCRILRIQVPGGSQEIAFEHEQLAVAEREELAQTQHNWLVSTGASLFSGLWPEIWLWDPPLTAQAHRRWLAYLEQGGKLVALYGPKDVREMQSLLRQNYPDRAALARIYSHLKTATSTIQIALAEEQLELLGLVGALPLALGVFLELGLWEVHDQHIIYLPPPTQKLDLEQTVLYNKGTTMRKQSSEYLKRSMERGFFQDGFKIENKGNTGFPKTRY